MSSGVSIKKLLKDVEVEWKQLGEVCEVKNGYTPSKSKKEYWKNGFIPWFRMEDIRKNGRILNDSIQHITSMAVKSGKLFPKNSIIISTTATIGEHALITTEFLCNQQLTVLSIRDSFIKYVNYKYLFYYSFVLSKWCRKNVNSAGFPLIGTTKIKSFQIPIPSLKIQSEIVRMLDNFTELAAELSAELSARKKQYSYYRDKLLSFEDNEVEWKSLGEVGEFIRGKRFVKTDIISEGIPCIHYGEMYTHYGIWANKTKSFVSNELVVNKKLRTAEKDDVVLVAAGETIEDIGLGTAWLGDEGVVIHDACFFYKSPLNPKYVAYFTRTRQFQKQIKKHISSGKISAINAKGLSKTIIPIPSQEEQARIVAILDKFDTLTNSISEGLPREIELRKKQYEYYRDLLLNFPKPEVKA